MNENEPKLLPIAVHDGQLYAAIAEQLQSINGLLERILSALSDKHAIPPPPPPPPAVATPSAARAAAARARLIADALDEPAQR